MTATPDGGWEGCGELGEPRDWSFITGGGFTMGAGASQVLPLQEVEKVIDMLKGWGGGRGQHF